jgi:hypothetical protein
MAGTTLERLVIELTTEGADKVNSDLKRTSQVVEMVGDKAQQAGTQVQSFAERIRSGNMSLVEMGFVAQNALAGIGQITRMLASFSGVNLAAEYQRITVSFSALLGSESKAKKLLGTLKDIGESTPFETLEMVKFARQLVSTGSNAEATARQLKTLSAFGMATGMDTAQVGEIISMMSGMRNRPRLNVEEIGALGARGLDIAKVVNAATGRSFGRQQAISYVSGQRGEKAFELLLRGIEKLYGNAGGSTFLGTMENLGEVFRNIMLPTGRLLLPVLGGIAAGFTLIGQFAGRVNELSGGFAGLSLIVMGVFRAKTFLVGSLKAAYDSTINLVRALSQYSATAGTAAVAGRMNVMGGSIPVGSAAVSGASVPINGLRASVGRAGGIGGWLKSLPGAAMGGMKGFLPKAAGFIKSAKGGSIYAVVGAIAGDILGGWLKNDARDKDGNITKPGQNLFGNILQGGIGGATIGGMGFAFGPIVGAITTSIGAIAGGIYGYFNGKKENSDPVAKNTEKMADSLEAIEGHLRGNVGERGRYSQTTMQLEYALKQQVMQGIG